VEEEVKDEVNEVIETGVLPERQYRQLDPGMGEAVARRTILRRTPDGAWETWGDVAKRVAEGNISLDPGYITDELFMHPELGWGAEEMEKLQTHIERATILMSGRHLQHGDKNQRQRPMEVFTNCSTASTSSLLILLLLSGSGVGRRYDDTLMKVDWAQQPYAYLILDADHPDAGETDEANTFRFWTKDQAQPLYDPAFGDEWFEVPDSREGWAQAIEILEAMTYEGVNKNRRLFLDFSKVRPAGTPIGGMQNRPASGPVPFMEAIEEVRKLRHAVDMPRWEQAMRVDHALAACVQVGGARRAARIAVKSYEDPGILDFIRIKESGNLWSANNSVGVDREFWRRVYKHREWVENGRPYTIESEADAAEYARCYDIFDSIMAASYEHGSGEPGIINLDQLNINRQGFFEMYSEGDFAGSQRYQLSERIKPLMWDIYRAVREMAYPMIVNPCSEIALISGPAGGFCVIADVAPYHAATLEEARDAFRTAARALVRVNRMDSIYNKETVRTNRIGVGFTGIFEFAWKFFRLGFRDLLDYEKSQDFWNWMQTTSQMVKAEANNYSVRLGMARPHTVTTVKPAGTTSKLFGLTEGAHLPAKIEYLRWVQFTKDDPLIDDYEARGYPVVRDIPGGHYTMSSIVGFPTAPVLGRLDIPREEIVTASQATMEEQYQWLQFVEHFWIGAFQGNQVSYTLKFDKAVDNYQSYRTYVLEYQPHVRCCSVIASSDWRATKALYGYVPEEPISKEEYDALVAKIMTREEEIELESLNCEGGACPI
jgi:ribonucleotide reductase alpha subunit